MNDKPDSIIKTIVLVHGGFVDGSGWEEVYKILKKDGYTVSVVQNPTISLADDVVQCDFWHAIFLKSSSVANFIATE